LLHRVFGKEQNFRATLGGRDRSAQASNTATDNQHIRDLLGQARGPEGNEITSMGQGLEHS
jgi:hypothetical protein